MERLFGTDGIRARAGLYPLDPRTVFVLGRSIGRFFGQGSNILIGMDTRESGPDIAAQLALGLDETGCVVHFGGVLPTPAVAALTASHPELNGGVVISASHNPYMDNGIKVFRDDGTKLTDDEEDVIEDFIRVDTSSGSTRTVDLDPEEKFQKHYIERLLQSVTPFPATRPLTIVVDSAHGAATRAVKEVFSHLPLDLIHIGHTPNGTNINHGVGSQHPELCRKMVLETGAAAGICLDGDGDRLILIDEMGNILTGDHLLYAIALDLYRSGQLPGNRIVATVMSNGGLIRALDDHGISVASCPVGDRYVWKAMMEENIYLGGEQSGHIINRHWSTSGDGLLNGLQVLHALAQEGKTLSQLAPIPIFPQTLKSFTCSVKRELETIPGYLELHARLIGHLAPGGRILVRYSGTEPKVRIMVEGEDPEGVTEVTEELEQFLKTSLS